MVGVEDLSLRISKKLGEKTNKNEEEIAVLNYGIFVIIHMFLGILATIIVGLLTDTMLEMGIITLTSSLMKRYSGGTHATSPERCLIIGVLISFIFSQISIMFIYNINTSYLMIFVFIILMLSYYILYRNCPVSSKNKQFNNEKRRILLRKKAFFTINIYTLILTLLLYYYIKLDILIAKQILVSVVLGLGIQVFVLTKYGKIIIEGMDKILNIKKIRIKDEIKTIK